MTDRQPNTLSKAIDWYRPGESRTFVVDGTPVTIRFVNRGSRRDRIAVISPTGTVVRINPVVVDKVDGVS
jgi:hypothetical protein